MEKNISHLVVAACMASMLTGCGIYTKYRQPETNTDGLFGALPEEVDTTSSLADLKWEEPVSYTHLTLPTIRLV